MQPGYPSPQPQPHNPMQPPAPQQPTGDQFPAPPYPHAPQPIQFPGQPLMSDIAPPQAYRSSMPTSPYTSPQSQQPGYPSAPTPHMPPMPQPLSDIAAPRPAYPQPSPQPQPHNPMQPPAPQQPNGGPFPVSNYQPPPQPVRSQVVQNIPVHIPAQTHQPGPQPYSPPQQRPVSPFNYGNPTNPGNSGLGDNRMEDILKDVNRNVSRPEADKKSSHIPEITDKLKIGKLKHHTKKAISQPKPVMMVVLAAITFLSLTTAAFLAFNNDGSASPTGPEVKVVGTTAAAGDSIQAGGGTLVSGQELDDLSNNLKKQVGGFNESQDFSQDPLSDQALGL